NVVYAVIRLDGRMRKAYFFFSSRRRHTRWPRDWSSDVCSSDLTTNEVVLRLSRNGGMVDHIAKRLCVIDLPSPHAEVYAELFHQIGRASCRGRVEDYVEKVLCGKNLA